MIFIANDRSAKKVDYHFLLAMKIMSPSALQPG